MALTPEQRQARMDQLKAEREKRMADAAAQRAASNPMFDPTNRPEAVQDEPGYVKYYGWVGGVTSGRWKLYKQSQTSGSADQVRSATERSQGGQTQATFSSAVGANFVPNPTTDAGGTGAGSGAGTGAGSGAGAGAGRQSLPPGFTAGAFPKELEQYFGAPPENIMGWKLTEYTDTAGKKYYKLSISQKGAYGDAIYGSSEFGAPITKDASGKWIPFQGDYSGGTGGTAGTGGTGGTGSGAEAGAGSGAGAGAGTGSLVGADGMTATQRDTYSLVVERLNRYGLGALAPLIKKLAIQGATEATIMLAMQEDPIYQERFKANQARISRGLTALTPSEYLNLEDNYRQVLRAYGLTQFDNDAYVSQFLANDVSVAELSNRVVAAVQRVRNADPAISSMLRTYYGIGQNDSVAYVLDPNQQFQKIERQIAASEIGVAAGRQGINIGVPVAEQLAAQGITQAEAQRGYATIADILPTAEKLSDIYAGMEEGYGLAEAEQEVFNTLASAQRKRQRLTQREIAAFSGTSGLGRTSLTGQTGGQF